MHLNTSKKLLHLCWEAEVLKRMLINIHRFPISIKPVFEYKYAGPL